jgi:serine phosphatase RsbU (regulator of sigma subunit)
MNEEEFNVEFTDVENIEKLNTKYQLEIIHSQIRKFSRITEIIAEGNFFFYHPREENLTPNSPIGVLARNFNKMIARIKDYQENLEKKVIDRTTKLENYIQEIIDLKKQQDGDYFLTSQLLKPFSKNKFKSSKIKIELLIEQKKKFTYKHWNDSLGGDICTINEVILRKRKYMLFMNADAMGKSIQGAGGALVFGSVFESIVQRTKLSTFHQSLYPEKWLAEAFIELQKVLETFEGTMFITTIIGLIEENTGSLYFINAQHPDLILYRNKKASFLRSKVNYSKLGAYSESFTKNILVNTYQLQTGDYLFCGSDGKDDLVLSIDHLGNREINENENLILEIIESSNGDISKVYESLSNKGEIIDDLSIIKIYFNSTLNTDTNSYKSILEKVIKIGIQSSIKTIKLNSKQILLYKNNKVIVLRKAVKIFYKLKYYKEVIYYGNRFLRKFPFSNFILLLVTLSYKRLKNYQKVKSNLEILNLRNPYSNKYEKLIKLLKE